MTLTRGLARVGAVLLSAIAAVPFLAAQVDPGDRVRVRLKTPPPTSGLTPYKTPPPSTHVGSVVTLGTDFLTVRTERDSAPPDVRARVDPNSREAHRSTPHDFDRSRDWWRRRSAGRHHGRPPEPCVPRGRRVLLRCNRHQRVPGGRVFGPGCAGWCWSGGTCRHAVPRGHLVARTVAPTRANSPRL